MLEKMISFIILLVYLRISQRCPENPVEQEQTKEIPLAVQTALFWHGFGTQRFEPDNLLNYKK